MIRASVNYYWAKVTSGVFMLVVKDYVNWFEWIHI